VAAKGPSPQSSASPEGQEQSRFHAAATASCQCAAASARKVPRWILVFVTMLPVIVMRRLYQHDDKPARRHAGSPVAAAGRSSDTTARPPACLSISVRRRPRTHRYQRHGRAAQGKECRYDFVHAGIDICHRHSPASR
jgi:hypothetical protein